MNMLLTLWIIFQYLFHYHCSSLFDFNALSDYFGTSAIYTIGQPFTCVQGSKVKCAWWSSHELKVLDGRHKLVVESYSTSPLVSGHLILHIKIWCNSCNSRHYWNLWSTTSLLSHQLLSIHGWNMCDWPLIPIHTSQMSLEKPNKYFSLILQLYCA